MVDTDKTSDTKDHSDSTTSTAPTSVTSDKPSTSRSRESTSNYASSSSGASRGRPRTRSELNPLSAANLEKRGYHTFNVLGKDFHVDKRWKLVRELGQGAYGIVVLAQDTISGENVAIKQVTRVFDKKELAKRALREIVLLRHFNHHENITGLIDMDLLTPDFNEIYLFMEPMEADLHQIIRSGQSLTNAHVQYFLYQLLRGCKFIHSANVIHRDLKPGNLLVNADCELKICDLGLSRAFDRSTIPNQGEESVSHMTEYVATRWYRAPEIMLSFKRYGTGIDVWSVGCILAELLGGKPMFKGRDYVDQLNLILKALGTPEERTIQKIGSEKAQTYIRSLPAKDKVPLSSLFPDADPLAVDLLEKMLAFDPSDRITVTEAISHPYLASYHEIGDEPECPIISDKWKAIEEIESDFEYRKAIWKEVYDFRLSVRSGTEGADGDEDQAAMGDEEAIAVDEEDFSNSVVKLTVNDLPPGQDSGAHDNKLESEILSRPIDGLPNTADPPLLEYDAYPTLAEIEESKDSLPPNAALPRTPLDPVPIAFPFPSIEGDARPQSPANVVRPLLHNRAPSSSSTLRPQTSVDPYTAYARRSNSLLFTPAQPQRRLQSESSAADDVTADADGGTGAAPEWVLPLIRSRAPSTDGGVLAAAGPLLRTLSTGGLSKLVEQVGKEAPQEQITQADLPASAMPMEFKAEPKWNNAVKS